jgi:hypothetical protein
MTQALLNSMDYTVLLREDQIKKEIEDTCKLECVNCRLEETIDIKSMRNTFPFTCSSCERMCEEPTAERSVSVYASTTTTQTQCAYYIQYSYPETVVTTAMSKTYCMY